MSSRVVVSVALGTGEAAVKLRTQLQDAAAAAGLSVNAYVVSVLRATLSASTSVEDRLAVLEQRVTMLEEKNLSP